LLLVSIAVRVCDHVYNRCLLQSNSFYESFKRRIEAMYQNSLYHVNLPPNLESAARKAHCESLSASDV
jgi:hypothetical protein